VGDRKWSLLCGEKVLSSVDTNVLVHAFDKRRSPKELLARRLLNALMEDDRCG
jgi:hypothetical protein